MSLRHLSGLVYSSQRCRFPVVPILLTRPIIILHICSSRTVSYKLTLKYFDEITKRYANRKGVLAWELGNGGCIAQHMICEMKFLSLLYYHCQDNVVWYVHSRSLLVLKAKQKNSCCLSTRRSRAHSSLDFDQSSFPDFCVRSNVCLWPNIAQSSTSCRICPHRGAARRKRRERSHASIRQ